MIAPAPMQQVPSVPGPASDAGSVAYYTLMMMFNHGRPSRPSGSPPHYTPLPPLSALSAAPNQGASPSLPTAYARAAEAVDLEAVAELLESDSDAEEFGWGGGGGGADDSEGVGDSD